MLLSYTSQLYEYIRTASFGAILIVVGACDDAPDTKVRQELQIDGRAADVSPDVFVSMLSLFEKTEGKARNENYESWCGETASSLSAIIDNNLEFDDDEFDAANFSINLKKQDQHEVQDIKFSFKAEGGQCGSSVSIQSMDQKY